MPCSDDEYLAALRAAPGREEGTAEHRAAAHRAAAELRGLLRAALGRSFGRQLDEGDLDDIVQESMLRLHARLDSFERKSRFTTWATAIAVHCALSELRRRRYRHVRLDDAIAQGHAALALEPEPEACAEQQLEALRQGVAEALTERQREATLAKLGDLPLMEIARRLGTSQGAVYKLLHDARRRLANHLADVERAGDAKELP